MRFFKYGEKNSEVLAIVLPGSLQRSSAVKEGDEYEFIELAPGAFFLASKNFLQETARKELVGRLAQRMFPAPPSIGEAEPSKPLSTAGAQKQSNPPSASTTSTIAPSVPRAQPPASRNDYLKALEKEGFMVIENEAEAKELSRALEQEIKQGSVKGVRGFDKRFYIVAREFYEANAQKILSDPARKECTVAEVAAACKTSETGAMAVLHLMKEEGEALEKRRGVFQIVK